MSVLAIIQLSLAALTSILPFVTKNSAYSKVASEVSSAIDGLTRAQQSIIDFNELESLRTHKTW